MDRPLHDYHQDDDGPPSYAVGAELLAMMEQSGRDRQTSPGTPLVDVLAKIDAAVARIEARIRARAA